MSVLWLRLVITFCLFCLTLTAKESSIEWRDVGGYVDIQCRFSGSKKTSFSLLKGLNEEQKVLYQEESGRKTISKNFLNRLELKGEFPNLALNITNLTTEDTGPYWCVYSEFDSQTVNSIDAKGDGSVLLVVTDKRPCDPPSGSLILVAFVISVAVLIIIFMTCLTCVYLKARRMRVTAKPRSAPTNDVYEDMRGTIRR